MARSLRLGVTGDATITYQWRKNQAPLTGQTSNTLQLFDLQNSDAATYDCVVANGFSATVSFPTSLTVTAVSVPSRLTNISVRGFTGTGAQSLAIGFVIGGTGSKNTLVRGGRTQPERLWSDRIAGRSLLDGLCDRGGLQGLE